MDGVTTIVKVAQMRLSYSRMPFVRAYFRETQEMVFDAHDRAFAFFKGACGRGVYDNLWTSPAQGDPLASAAGMHESIRPVCGTVHAPGLDESPLLWPHNMIGHGGLVVNQA
jgi:transposase